VSASTHDIPRSKDQVSYPAIQISYECVLRERVRESVSYHYEVACSIAYAAKSGYLSMKVTGQNTYRNSATRDVPFTLHERGATTYVELLEGEQLEIRVVDYGSAYSKAFYYAHGQELIEQNVRGVVSNIQRIDANSETKQNGTLA
jgi:hypothetical protein